MLNRILHRRESKALLVLPYVALVQEKVRWLRQLVEGLSFPPPEREEHVPFSVRPSQDGLRVVGFFGGGKVRAGWDDFDIGVCTLEKVDIVAFYMTELYADYGSGQHACQRRHRRLLRLQATGRRARRTAHD